MPDHDRLLADVLAEAAPEDFRATMLAETLRLARRRRVIRQLGRAGSALVVLVTVGIFSWSRLRTGVSADPTPLVSSVASCETVQTASLAPITLVVTASGGMALTTTESDISIVYTTPGNNLRMIDDEELLALAAPRHPALVRNGPHSQELIFLIGSEPLN